MEKIIEQLHRKHPVKMAQLYVKYGIPKARLNVQTTKDLMTVFGDDFAYDLNRATGFEGDAFFGKLFKKKDSAGTEGTEGEEKPKFLDKLRNFGKKAVGAYTAIQSQNQATQSGSMAGVPAKDEKIMGMSKPMFYALVSVILILLVYVLTQKKQSA